MKLPLEVRKVFKVFGTELGTVSESEIIPLETHKNLIDGEWYITEGTFERNGYSFHFLVDNYKTNMSCNNETELYLNELSYEFEGIDHDFVNEEGFSCVEID